MKEIVPYHPISTGSGSAAPGRGPHRPGTGPVNRRFFVLTSGRSGSSLLCAVLAEAGADFGMPVPDAWRHGEGAMEHPVMRKAIQGYARTSGIRPVGIDSLAWRLARVRAKANLGKALAAAAYFKDAALDRVVVPTVRAGYEPVAIVSLREFRGATSGVLRLRMSDVQQVEDSYVRTYRNALALLYRNGGCVVDYDDLTDPAATGWAAKLARVSGLDERAILEARDRRLVPRTGRPPIPLSSPAAEAIYSTLRNATDY